MLQRLGVLRSLLIVAALTVVATEVAAQENYSPPPPTGLGGVIAGSVLTGLGALNLAYTPLCNVEGLEFGLGASTCMVAQLIGGGVFLLAGVPTLIAGGVRRSRYKEWRRNNSVALTPIILPDYSGLALLVHF